MDPLIGDKLVKHSSTVEELKKVWCCYVKGNVAVINPRRACAARVTVVNPRRACAARVTVVGFVCLSVTLHLTSRVSVRPRNDTIYPTGDEGQKIKAVFSENAPLQS